MAYSRTLNHFTSMQELATIWASGTSYLVNQLVVRNNFLYRCAIAHTSSGSFQTDQAAGDWERVSSAENAIGWATGIYYVLNQLVIDSDKLYKCLVAHTSGATFIADLQSSYWVEISASEAGVFNYIGNADAEVDTSGWSTYADAAGTQPVDGSGGSPAITFSRSTTTPLRGDADFNLVKGGSATRQGNGVAYDFTIDRADLAKVLTVTFDYEILSGTYATGDLTVYIIQDPTGTPVVIQPAGYRVQAATAGTTMKHIATFQTASNVTSYRLCIHVATTSALDYSLAIDNVICGPQVVQYGAPVTDWSSIYSFTPNSFGTVANSNYKTRRVGDSLEVIGYFTTGTNALAVASLSLPAGLSIDSSKLSSGSGGTLLGFVVANETGAQRNVFYAASTTGSSDAGIVFYDGSDTSKVYFAQYSTSNAYTKSNASSIFNSNANISFQFTIPILGWSSTVQMSNDTDTRVVVARARLTSASVAKTMDNSSAVSLIDFNIVDVDTHGAITTGASWKFTAPISGYYKISCVVQSASTANPQTTFIKVYKNGSYTNIRLAAAPVAGSTIPYLSGSTSGLFLNAGDYIDIRGGTTDPSVQNISTAADSANVAIERLSGPSAIAASETVAAKFWASANGTSNSTTPINFDSKVYDSHGSVTTGASWKFTAPISGKYSIKCFVNNGAGNAAQFINIHKSGVALEALGFVYVAANALSQSTTVQLNAGESIDIRGGGTYVWLGSATSAGGGCMISIERVGQ